MSLPKRIKLTFTKEDVEEAGPYEDPHDCLICTAMKRRGYKYVNVIPSAVYVNSRCSDEVRYDIKNGDGVVFNSIQARRRKPYYHPSVIGAKVTLIRS